MEYTSSATASDPQSGLSVFVGELNGKYGYAFYERGLPEPKIEPTLSFADLDLPVPVFGVVLRNDLIAMSLIRREVHARANRSSDPKEWDDTFLLAQLRNPWPQTKKETILGEGIARILERIAR